MMDWTEARDSSTACAEYFWMALGTYIAPRFGASVLRNQISEK
jgi:hypothetical protein